MGLHFSLCVLKEWVYREMSKISWLRNKCIILISYFPSYFSFDRFPFANMSQVFRAKVSFSLAGLSESYGSAFRFSHVISGAFSYRTSICFCTTPKRIGNIYICMRLHTYTNPFQLAFQDFYFSLRIYRVNKYFKLGKMPHVFAAALKPVLPLCFMDLFSISK